MSQEKRRHIRKWATTYSIFGDKVYHTLVDGSQTEVPLPEARRDIITSNHEETGHIGVLRTTYRIGLKYWWKGRRADVEQVLSVCSVCDRVKASFNAVHPSLHPLPIEHFSKWVEVVPLRSKKSLRS
jgi:hypothetical protein